MGTRNRHVKFGWKIPNSFGKIALSPQGGFFFDSHCTNGENKTGTSTHRTSGHYAGHCHASWLLLTWWWVSMLPIGRLGQCMDVNRGYWSETPYVIYFRSMSWWPLSMQAVDDLCSCCVFPIDFTSSSLRKGAITSAIKLAIKLTIKLKT